MKKYEAIPLTGGQMKRLPKTPAGKIDLRSKQYKVLKEAYENQQHRREHNAVESEAALDVTHREPPKGGQGSRGTYVPMEYATAKLKANHRQVGGDHYKGLGIEPWDVEQAWMTHEQFQGFLLGSAISYLARFNIEGQDGKGGIKDVKKAHHYLEKLIEVTEGV